MPNIFISACSSQEDDDEDEDDEDQTSSTLQGSYCESNCSQNFVYETGGVSSHGLVPPTLETDDTTSTSNTDETTYRKYDVGNGYCVDNFVESWVWHTITQDKRLGQLPLWHAYGSSKA